MGDDEHHVNFNDYGGRSHAPEDKREDVIVDGYRVCIILCRGFGTVYYPEGSFRSVEKPSKYGEVVNAWYAQALAEKKEAPIARVEPVDATALVFGEGGVAAR